MLFISAHFLLENYDVHVGIKIKMIKLLNLDGKVVGLEDIILRQMLRRCRGREYTVDDIQAHRRVFDPSNSLY